MLRLLLLAAAATVAVVTGGCLRDTSFACSSAEQCEPGTCVAVAGGASYCAIADSACASGYRFTDSAGPHAGACTDGGAPSDGGVDGTSDATDGAPIDGPELRAERSENVCHEGAPFPHGYSECTDVICERMPSCCTSSWSKLCVQLVELECAGADWRCSIHVLFAGTGVVQLWEDGNEDEVFDLVASGGVIDPVAPYRTVAAGDLDGDGRLEVVATSASANGAGDNQHLMMHRDFADDTQLVAYRDLLDVQPLLDNANAWEAVIGDHDGDGYADILLGGNGSAFVLRNLGDDLFTDVPAPPDTEPYYDVSSIDTGDLDADGRDDLVVADYNGHVALVSWDGFAMTWEPFFVTLPNITRRVAVGPFDDDDDLDVAVSGYDYIHVYENVDGTLDASEPIWSYDVGGGEPPDFTDIEWLDANDDGHFDLLAGMRHGDLLVFEGTATGLQQAPRWISAAPQPSWGLAVGDVDHDGDVDIVGVNDYGENFVYTNDTPDEEEITFRRVWGVPVAEGEEFFGVDLTTFAP